MVYNMLMCYIYILEYDCHCSHGYHLYHVT